MSDWENKLEELFTCDDLSTIKTRLSSCPDSHGLRVQYLSLVRKTKNYSTLPLIDLSPTRADRSLEPLIGDSDLIDFYPLITNAIQEGNFFLLEKFLPRKLEPSCVSRACAYSGVDFDLIPKSLADFWIYIGAIIETDNLGSFLKYQSLYNSDVPFILARACKYCARKIITHFGLTKENVGYCLTYAFLCSNKDTLLFLYDKCVGKQIEYTFLWHLSMAQANIDHSFLVDCFHSGLITLTEEGWQRLKSRNAELYQKVQDDV